MQSFLEVTKHGVLRVPYGEIFDFEKFRLFLMPGSSERNMDEI